MPRRLRFILITLAVLVVPAVIILLLVDRSPTLSNTVLRLANQSTNVNGNTNTPTNTNAVQADPEAIAVEYVARNFSETYGSGTNQNDFAHIEQAKLWGTENFNSFLDRTANQERATLVTTPYHGIVSQALVVQVTNRTATSAAATVSLQRTETIDQDERTYTQDLLLNLVKVGTDWKINAAAWAPAT